MSLWLGRGEEQDRRLAQDLIPTRACHGALEDDPVTGRPRQLANVPLEVLAVPRANKPEACAGVAVEYEQCRLHCLDHTLPRTQVAQEEDRVLDRLGSPA